MAPAPSAQKMDGEDILQAVVVADSFDQKFMPLTLDYPRCLIPLCNVPLIEYTLEFLAVAKVQEVFIMCCAHSTMIKKYVASSSWSRDISPMKVHVCIARDSLSMGDVLRELDTSGRIKSDFVLVNGDVVSNLNLKHILDRHQQRKLTDKNLLMSMILKESSPFHRSRGNPGIFCINPISSTLVQYIAVEDPLSLAVVVAPEVIADNDEVTIRNDLIDCEVDICSPEVLALFSENFDYQVMRKDFVAGILESDLVSKTIYCDIVDEDYGIRVRNTQLYDCISMDVICRWVYPLVPDSNFYETTYRLARNNVYREEPVMLTRTANLAKNVVIGTNSTVGEGTTIAFSVVGRNCTIGKNVTMSHAYLWDGCTIGDNCTIEYAILSVAVTIKDHVGISRGCILGKGVVVGAGVVVPHHTRLTVSTWSDPTAVGEEGSGIRWFPDLVKEVDRGGEFTDRSRAPAAALSAAYSGANGFSDTDDDGEYNRTRSTSFAAAATTTTAAATAAAVLGCRRINRDCYEPDPNSEDEQDQLNALMNDIGYDSGMLRARIEDIYQQDIEGVSLGGFEEDTLDRENNESNADEIKATVLRALEQSHTIENTLLELNTLKFACNLSFRELQAEVAPCIFNHVFRQRSTAVSNFERWLGVFVGLIHKPTDQVQFLELMFAWFCANPDYSKFIQKFTSICYFVDLVDEETYLEWYYAEETLQKNRPCTNNATILRHYRDFTIWLEENHEETDEEEEVDDNEEVDEEEDDDEETDYESSDQTLQNDKKTNDSE